MFAPEARMPPTVGPELAVIVEASKVTDDQTLMLSRDIARKIERDLPRLAGHGGLDALAVGAVTQLDQAETVEPQPGDAARLGGAHQAGGRGAQGQLLGRLDVLGAGG